MQRIEKHQMEVGRVDSQFDERLERRPGPSSAAVHQQAGGTRRKPCSVVDLWPNANLLLASGGPDNVLAVRVEAQSMGCGASSWVRLSADTRMRMGTAGTKGKF